MHEWMGGLIGERGRDHGVAKCLENVTELVGVSHMRGSRASKSLMRVLRITRDCKKWAVEVAHFWNCCVCKVWSG